MKKILASLILCVAGGLLAAASLHDPGGPANLSGGSFDPTVCMDPFAGLPGRELTDAESAALTGGDVEINMNAARTKITVMVTTNNPSKNTRYPSPATVYEFEAHNRIGNTTNAPWMPAPCDTDREFPNRAVITTQPAPFPTGNWKITNVAQTAGNYGPFMISTNAVGSVKVFADGKDVGIGTDTGYAIHSNIKPFDSSQSNGCIVIRREDNAKLAQILISDRKDREDLVVRGLTPRTSGIQFISVNDRN